MSTILKNNFWSKLPAPFFVLAPMADVTDTAFRRMIAKYGKPDVTWTEFVSVDGLLSPGREVLLHDLLYTDAERPIVAQIFGSDPDHFYKVAGLIKELGFDGIDINMGCPDRSVEKQHAGASLIKDPSRARAIITATKEGGGGLPVSVKTRVGYNNVEIDTWIPSLISAGPSAITIHARTRKEMSLVPARWEHVQEVVQMAKGTGIRIIGNGDVKSLEDASQRISETGADGAMVGRGIFGNPWFFNKNVSFNDIAIAERLKVMIEHTRLFETLLGQVKNFAVMKKHYKAYVNGFDGAKELRIKLMETTNADEVEMLVNEFLGQ